MSKKLADLDPGSRVALACVQCAFLVGLLGALVMLAAGTLDWPHAWVFLGVYAVCFMASTSTLFLKTPELMDERRKRHDDIKPWDKWLVLAYQTMYFPIFIVSGLDHRYGWSAVPGWVSAGGMVLFVGSFVLFTWAPLANAHLETYIRIQHDRHHTVCDTGPYRYVRHPAYAGLALFFITISLGLGSWWGLIPSVVGVCFLLVRTRLEDRILKAELPGYQAYSQKVRFRLVPGIW